MKQLFFMTFCISFIIVSCSRQQNEENFEEIRLNQMTQKDLVIDDSFELLKIVQLETTPESAIKYISKVYKTEDKIIVFDSPGKSIFIFDLNGDFLYKISNIGRGPEEYLTIDDIIIDFASKRILILDGEKEIILEYSLKGNFIARKNLNFAANEFQNYEDKFIFFPIVKNDYDKNPKNIIVTDSSFNFLWSAKPFDSKWAGRAYKSSFINSTFSINQKNELLFIPPIPFNTNKIYRITPTSVHPYLDINMKANNNNSLKSLLNKLNPNKVRAFDKLVEENLFFNLHNFIETKNNLFFRVVGSEDNKMLFHNILLKKENNIFFVSKGNKPDPKHGFFRPFKVNMAHDNNMLANVVTPYDVKQHSLKLFNPQKYKFNDNDNPFIVFYKIQE